MEEKPRDPPLPLFRTPPAFFEAGVDEPEEKNIMEPTTSHKRYVIDQAFPDGAWYLWTGEDEPPHCGTLNEMLKRVKEKEEHEDSTKD